MNPKEFYRSSTGMQTEEFVKEESRTYYKKNRELLGIRK
jgi:hypothetical protein